MFNYLTKEERLNAISHGVGILLGFVFLPILLNTDSSHNFLNQVSLCIYGISFIVLFLASTLYHAITNPQKKHLARKFDHISIFFHIAGTYTPVCLITLIDSNGWLLFILIWSFALLGFILKLFLTGKFNKLSTLLYLGMGWIAILEFKNLFQLFDQKTFFCLTLGGLFYTLGVFFYASKKIKYHHFIWHLFVLAGAVSHFLMIYFVVKSN